MIGRSRGLGRSRREWGGIVLLSQRKQGRIVPEMLLTLADFCARCDAIARSKGEQEARTLAVKERVLELSDKLRALRENEGSAFYPVVPDALGLAKEVEKAVGIARDAKVEWTVIELILQGFEQYWCKPEERTRWSFPSSNREMPGSVLALPVALSHGQGGMSAGGAIYYLWAHPKNHRRNDWEFTGFSSDQRESALDGLARLAISVVTFMPPRDVPPREIAKVRGGYQFELLFENSIDTGKSHFAAIVVLLVICYLHATLDDEALSLIKEFNRHVVITAEIDNDGQVKPVGGLREKLNAVIDAWGWNVCFGVAESDRIDALNVLEKRLLLDTQRGLPSERLPASLHDMVYGFTTAEGLVEGVLGSLKDVRDEWLRRLTPNGFKRFQNRLPDDRRKRWAELRRAILPPSDASSLSEHVWGKLDRADGGWGRVSLAFSESSLDDKDLMDRRAIVIACAADETDNAKPGLWSNGDDLSPVARLVHAIVEVVHGAGDLGTKTKIFVHLLSEGRPALEIDRFMSGKEIDQALRAFRFRHGGNEGAEGSGEQSPWLRGRFLRPILDYWAQHPREFDLAELLLFTWEEIPDRFDELVDDHYRDFARVTLCVPTGDVAAPSWLTNSSEQAVSYSAGQGPDKQYIQEAFGRPSFLFNRLVINLGGQCPICWNTAKYEWKLARSKGKFVLTTHVGGQGAVTIESQFRMWRDISFVELGVGYSEGALNRASASLTNSTELNLRCSLSNTTKVPTWKTLVQGELNDHELKNWSQGQICQDCVSEGREAKHLVCPHRVGSVTKLALPAVQSALAQLARTFGNGRRDVLVILNTETGWFGMTTSGCRIPNSDWGVVLCDESIWLVSGEGEKLDEVPRITRELYSAKVKDQTFEFAKTRLLAATASG